MTKEEKDYQDVMSCETLFERFWQQVNIQEEAECWDWQASGRGGYGRIKVNGRKMSAHRISWMWRYGPIPPGLYILHECDNTFCVNSSHLYAGTQIQNMRDVSKLVRMQRTCDNKSNARLSSQEIKKIWLLGNEGLTQLCIASEIGCSRSVVQKVLGRKEYRTREGDFCYYDICN